MLSFVLLFDMMIFNFNLFGSILLFHGSCVLTIPLFVNLSLYNIFIIIRD